MNSPYEEFGILGGFVQVRRTQNPKSCGARGACATAFWVLFVINQFIHEVKHGYVNLEINRI